MHFHLTEETMQRLAENAGRSQAVPQEVENCTECRSRFETYRALFLHLKTEPDFLLDPNFASRTARALLRPKKRVIPWDAAALIAGIGIAVLTAFWVLDYKAIIKAFNNFRLPLPDMKPLAEIVTENPSLVQYGLRLGLPAILVLGFFVLVDRLIRSKGPTHYCL